MLVKIHTAALNGLEAMPVLVEVNTQLLQGQQAEEQRFHMVGLPDNAVRESRLRVLSALQNSGFKLPGFMRYVVNFAPADIRKEGSGYDLPLALGMLAGNNMLPAESMQRIVFVGELGLDGSLRSVRGMLSIAIKARSMGFDALIVPQANAQEAAVVNRLKVYGATTLAQVVAFLNGHTDALQPTDYDTRAEFAAAQRIVPYDFAEVKGQIGVKRAFEVAAAGGHNVLMVGSPGCGKSMMAKRLPSILPPLSLAESLETTQIHSVAGLLAADSSLITQRPFRSPHHNISDAALIGGGTYCRPGEISMAHNGVLFLDELPEFSRTALEAMRQPLEDRCITISRAKYNVTLPCSFMLVGAMNPCPCGYYTHPTRPCTCTPGQRQQYMKKISGPLLDRFDIQIEVTPVPVDELSTAPAGENSAAIRQRVVAARERQTERYSQHRGIHCNAQMTDRMLTELANLTPAATERLKMAMQMLDLSARAYGRIIKVARTIADLEQAEAVSADHIAEAVAYRSLDRRDWAEA